MIEIPTLETERLVLRGPRDGDEAAYAAFYADGAASHFYGGPKRVDQAWRRMAEDLGHWALRGFGSWIMERRVEVGAIGACGLHHPLGWPRAELTWWLLPQWRGAGYATEASHAVIDFAISELQWPRVETHFQDANTPARRLVERLGGAKIARESFPDGVERDVFALRCSDSRSAATDREATI